MVSKTQPVIPPVPPIHLETIYEESGSSLSSSIVDVQHQSRHRQNSSTYSTNQTIHGLISARSIPSVDVHRRRRENEQQQKLPIEVRYRDGTKRYIHPSLTTITPMIMNRRKTSHSSRHESSISSSSSSSSATTKINTKYRQIFNTTPKKKKKLPKKSDMILTIITAEDLSQAGITPPSASSPDESDTLALTKSHSNSSLDTIKTLKDVSLKDTVEVPKERLQIATVPPSVQLVQPVIDISVSNIRFLAPPRHHSQHQQQLRHPQHIPTIRSQSLPPSQTRFPPSNQQILLSHPVPPVAVIPPSPKRTLPSLQITLTSDENKRNLSSKVKLPNPPSSSSKSIIETTNSESKQPFRPSATVLVGGGSRSAFRPFLKPTTINPQPPIPLNMNVKSHIPTNQFIQNSSQQQQQQIILPSDPHLQQFQPTSLSSMTHFTLQSSSKTNPITYDRRSISSETSKQPLNSIITNPIMSDKVMNSTLKIQTSNHPQQSASIPTTNIPENSFNQIPKSKDQIKDIQSHLFTVDQHLQWHSVTSKSLYDVPRLSHQYSNIPLRITIPDGTPTQNQKLLYKHDIALEKRLLDAGLSPETIALYERILEVADIRQMDIISPPKIINQYSHKSLL